MQSPGPHGPGDSTMPGSDWLDVFLVQLERLFVAFFGQLQPHEQAGQHQQWDDYQSGKGDAEGNPQDLEQLHRFTSTRPTCRPLSGSGARLSPGCALATQFVSLGDQCFYLVARVLGDGMPAPCL